MSLNENYKFLLINFCLHSCAEGDQWPVRRNEWRHHYTGNLLLLAPSTHLTHQAQVQIFIIERIIICVMESWCQHEHSHRSHKSSPAPLIMELWLRSASGWCQSPVWANDDNDSNVRGCDWQLPASASQPPSLWWEETAQPHNNQRRRGQKMRPASILLTQLLRTFMMLHFLSKELIYVSLNTIPWL